MLTLFTLVNPVASAKKPQIRSHKWRRMWPNFGWIVTCCRAEPSRTFSRILRPNFGVCQTSAHLYNVQIVLMH